jgi:PEP-CTERM motif
MKHYISKSLTATAAVLKPVSIAAILLGAPQVEAAVVEYTSAADFFAATTDQVTYGFDGIVDPIYPFGNVDSVDVGPATFTDAPDTSLMFVINPSFGAWPVSFLSGFEFSTPTANHSINVAMEPTTAIAFNFGSYFSADAPVIFTLSTGDAFTFDLPGTLLTSEFAGFVSDTEITSVSISTMAAVLDILDFTVATFAPPRSTAEFPLLPDVSTPPEEGEPVVFDFPLFDVEEEETVFIDPVIAVGYDYIINSGPIIASVLLPTIVSDDGQYTIWLWDGADNLFDIFLSNATAGDEFFFADHGYAAGVDRFRVLGIDHAALLDPTNPVAFVTGLTFVSAGTVDMSMAPVTFDTDAGGGGEATDVPEPTALTLFGAGLFGLGWMRRRASPRFGPASRQG